MPGSARRIERFNYSDTISFSEGGLVDDLRSLLLSICFSILNSRELIAR